MNASHNGAAHPRRVNVGAANRGARQRGSDWVPVNVDQSADGEGRITRLVARPEDDLVATERRQRLDCAPYIDRSRSGRISEIMSHSVCMTEAGESPSYDWAHA